MACAGVCPSEALLRRRLTAIGVGIQLENIHSPGTLFQRELARPVAMATFGLLVSTIALCAGAAGLFGLLAQFVADRRREFAVRACLGASRAALRSLVWRQALSVVMPGLLVGGIGAQWASSVLAGLYVDSARVTVWLVLSSVVTLVVIGAAWAPLRAATRIAPIELLRE
jgi:ABC-type antimicrobial peptide transport system permease subunit